MLIVCDFPFVSDIVMVYLPGSSLMLVGVDLSSSLMSIALPFSSTILSSSPHGDAESSRRPLFGGRGALDVGAVVVTTVELTGATGVAGCLFFKMKAPPPKTIATMMPTNSGTLLLFFGANDDGETCRSIIVASAAPGPLHFCSAAVGAAVDVRR